MKVEDLNGATTPSLLTRTWERPASEESDRRQHSSSAIFILVFTLLFEDLLVSAGFGRGTSQWDRLSVVIKKDKQALWMLDDI